MKFTVHVTASFFVIAYHVLLFNALVNVNLFVPVLYALLLLVLPAVVLNHTNVGVLLHAVTVGASTVQLVSCVAPLYTSAKLHVLFAVLLNVDPFAFHFAVNVTATFLLCAYAVVPLLLAFNVTVPALVHTPELCTLAHVLNQITVGVALAGVIVGHVLLQLCVGAVPFHVNAVVHHVLVKLIVFQFHVKLILYVH